VLPECSFVVSAFALYSFEDLHDDACKAIRVEVGFLIIGDLTDFAAVMTRQYSKNADRDNVLCSSEGREIPRIVEMISASGICSSLLAFGCFGFALVSHGRWHEIDSNVLASFSLTITAILSSYCAHSLHNYAK
jgi:hypothetical protein